MRFSPSVTLRISALTASGAVSIAGAQGATLLLFNSGSADAVAFGLGASSAIVAVAPGTALSTANCGVLGPGDSMYIARNTTAQSHIAVIALGSGAPGLFVTIGDSTL